MKKYLLLLLIGISTTTFAKNKEKLEFQCTLNDGAVLSVHSTTPHYIYRLSKKGKIKIEIKETKRKAMKKNKETLFISLLKEEGRDLYFTRGEYDYRVFSAYPTTTGKYAKFFNGTEIQSRDGKFSQHFVCLKVNKFLPMIR